MQAAPRTYRTRLADRLMDELLEQLSALFVVGPRASGKTTTASRRARTSIGLDGGPRLVLSRLTPTPPCGGCPSRCCWMSGRPFQACSVR